MRAVLSRIALDTIMCVTWYDPPALYIAPIIFAPAIYFSVRYAVLDYIRAAVDPNLTKWRKNVVHICNLLYVISVWIFLMIFVVPPTFSAVWHTISFGQYIFFRYGIVVGNYVEVDVISRASWVFLIIYSFISVRFLAVLYINYINFDTKQGPTLPWAINMIFDYSWFACLVLTEFLLPKQVPLKLTYKQSGSGGEENPPVAQLTTNA